ncbi:MAG: rod shape-determining protein [Clostridia bacterium]|nr:rod shape-determining protein [Clostridia bacterium]
MFGIGQDIGIDLGTSSVLMSMRGRGVVLHEPSIAVVDRKSRGVVSVGASAQLMNGRTPTNMIEVHPLSGGAISDYGVTEQMLRVMLKKVCSGRIFKPAVTVSVPSGVTEVEKRAVIDAAECAGAARVATVAEPIAAATGAGVDITRPIGTMIVDIGGGTTDVAVLSLGEIIVSECIKVAGNSFDDSIMRYIRRTMSLIIGERTAENIKKEIGCATVRNEDVSVDFKGRSLASGLPQTASVSGKEICEALTDDLEKILNAILSVLENTPPELSGDISDEGIVITGGSALLYGIDTFVSQATGLKVRVADDPESAVARGLARMLK